jgi:hypothetical protein
VNLGLHTHEKALPDEAGSVGRLGMTYIHIPVDFQNPTEEAFDKFCAMMEELRDVPVHGRDCGWSKDLHDSPLEGSGFEPSVPPSLGRLKPLVLLVQRSPLRS